MNTDPAIKVARQKLSALELAQTWGNVSEAGRQCSESRTSIYEYKKRFEKAGLEGLKGLPPIVKPHPFTTPEETVEHIVALSLESPVRGCNFIMKSSIPEHKKRSSVHDLIFTTSNENRS